MILHRYLCKMKNFSVVSVCAPCATQGFRENRLQYRISLHFLPHPAVGSQQRRPSHDTALSLRRSTSGLRSRWLERGIPEAYEIKVYEIDNVQKMQKRAGAGKQVLGLFCFFGGKVNGHCILYDLYLP